MFIRRPRRDVPPRPAERAAPLYSRPSATAELLEPRLLLASTVQQVLDLNTNPSSSSPASMLAIGNTLYFVANDRTHGRELWKTDGTPGGTTLLKDISPGSASSFPSQLTNVAGTLYFTADDGVHGAELWKSDGTAAGTMLVMDINTKDGSSIGELTQGSSITELTVVNGNKLFFTAKDGVHGRELWTSGGTAQTTYLVVDQILNDTPSSGPWGLTDFNGTLYCVYSIENEHALVKSDGTPGGTIDVKSFDYNGSPGRMVAFQNRLYFSIGQRFWRSDGTWWATSGPEAYAYAFAATNDTLFFTGGGPEAATSQRQLWKVTPDGLHGVMVKDFGPDNRDGIELLGNLGGTLYFTIDDGVHGVELWRSDGTDAGTSMVSDIAPGKALSYPRGFMKMGNALYFSASVVGDTALYRTDLTQAGTVLVRDLVPAQGAELNGYLYFGAADKAAAGDVELWRSDGTSAGTAPFKDLMPGTSDGGIQGLANINDTLYFGSSSPLGLWKTNGTAAGTVAFNNWGPPRWVDHVGATVFYAFDGAIMKSGNTATDMAVVWAPPQTVQFAVSAESHAVGANGYLFFALTTAGNARQVWRTDGTAAGTVLLLNAPAGTIEPYRLLATATGQVLISGVDGLWRTDGTAAGTTLLSASTWAAPMVERDGLVYLYSLGTLWKTDGTIAGTVRVADNMIFGTPTNLTASGNAIYFTLEFVFNKVLPQLWTSDGTAAGTVRLASNLAEVLAVADAADTLYFLGDEGGRYSLWKSDGTTAGTVKVKDVGDYGGPPPKNLTAVGGRVVYFTAWDAAAGEELWRSDGTFFGTTRVADVNPGLDSASPRELTAIGDTLYFSADDGFHGRELWRASIFRGAWDGDNGSTSSAPARLSVGGDGKVYFTADEGAGKGNEFYTHDPAAGTTSLLKDIAGGSGSPRVSKITWFGATGYFSADAGGTSGAELWQTDGTAAGTVPVQDINPGSASSNPTGFTLYNGAVYFTATNATTGTELWKVTRGTVSLVKDINAGTASSSPTNLVVYNNALYFRATDAAGGAELWKTDGTTTVRVKDIVSGTGGSSPANLTVANDLLYFTAADATNGTELWKSDGSAAGTVLVKDIAAGAGGSFPALLTAVGSTLFFTANDGLTGMELWKSDGTAAGTVLVKDLADGATGSAPASLIAVGATLYFAAEDSVKKGRELWQSDGTSGGTVLVADINPGPAGSSPTQLVNAQGRLYFVADDGVHGPELWTSTGKDGSTVMVADTYPGATGSAPDELVVDGDWIVYSADDGTNGRELWQQPVWPTWLAPTAGAAMNVVGSTVHLRGAVTLTADAGNAWSLSVHRGATLKLASSQHLATLTVSGSAQLATAARHTLSVDALTVGLGGTLDVGGGQVITALINGQPATTAAMGTFVTRAAGTRRADGSYAWNGVGGITSVLAQADAAGGNPGRYSIAIADAKDNALTGLGLLTGQVAVRFAAYGDANFDDKVDIADLSIWNNNFGSGNHTATGDFNYDGVVDIADLSIWNNNFGASMPAGDAAPGDSAPAPSAVPPPSAVVPAPPGAVADAAAAQASPAPSQATLVQASLDTQTATTAPKVTAVIPPTPPTLTAEPPSLDRYPLHLMPVARPVRRGSPLKPKPAPAAPPAARQRPQPQNASVATPRLVPKSPFATFMRRRRADDLLEA